jgi:hypothetical protein
MLCAKRFIVDCTPELRRLTSEKEYARVVLTARFVTIQLAANVHYAVLVTMCFIVHTTKKCYLVATCLTAKDANVVETVRP